MGAEMPTDTKTETISPTEASTQPRIIRGQVDSLSLYEITDYELEVLEQGSPNSIFLNFAMFFLSIAASFLTTLATVKIDSIHLFVVFVVLITVGFAGGTVLLVLWFQTRSRVRDVVKRIKARVPVGPTAPQTTPRAEDVGAAESM